MSAVSLSEPAVLATAKEFLTQGLDGGYAVVDAQFGRDSWGNDLIPEAVRQQLQPINSLPMGNGYPDALIAPPRSDLYRVAGNADIDSIPLAVVEAKGETDHTDRNTGRIAIAQAHSHLEEANIGYVALPRSSITGREHALARELNIGLLAVDDTGAELLELPRMVGSESSTTTDTVRFHAKLGGVAVESLKKNHPKNAIGYALAVAADADTDDIFKEYVIQSVDDARRDATALGLVGDGFDHQQLTALGREAVRTIEYHHDGTLGALEAIHEQTGSTTRFIDVLPIMGTVARQVLLTYPPTQVLVHTLDELAERGEREPSLAQVAKAIAKKRPDFALDLFVSPADRNMILKDTTDRHQIDLERFENGSVYSTHTTFQYKAILYHVGILTERGTDRKDQIEPTEAVWALENAV